MINLKEAGVEVGLDIEIERKGKRYRFRIDSHLLETSRLAT
jgi:hypothetical protein